MEIKHKFNFKLLDFVNQQTPKDAIIIFPSKEIIKNAKELDNGKNRSASLKNKAYASYFVYPRRIVYEDMDKENELWAKATHVLIIEGHGYNHLKYNIDKKSKYSVLPINNK